MQGRSCRCRPVSRVEVITIPADRKGVGWTLDLHALRFLDQSSGVRLHSYPMPDAVSAVTQPLSQT